MSYNLTNVTNANTFLEQFVAINSLTGDIFAIMLLFTLFIVMFLTFKNYDTRVVLLGSSFIISLISVMFLWAGIIGTTPVMICVGMLVLSLVLATFWQ